MEISASDYIQLGSMLILVATTFIIPFIQRPMLSVDYPNNPTLDYVNKNITIANNGITALHNVKGSIVIPHATSPIQLIPDKYVPWSLGIKSQLDSIHNGTQTARAAFNMSILPPQVTVTLNVKATLAKQKTPVSTLISVFSDEWDGNPQFFIWGINAAVLIVGSVSSYKLYRLFDRTLRRHE